jgi:hypothetical protein
MSSVNLKEEEVEEQAGNILCIGVEYTATG